MGKREFLGWDRPFLGLLVDWLLARKEEIPGFLVVLPTAQAGRRLREALAVAGGCLSPRIVTPGSLLQTEGTAPSLLEHLAWVETLESVTDWSPYEAAFPIPPTSEEPPGWAFGLAATLAKVRTGLQENGLTLATAARQLEETIEVDRWRALAGLELAVEKRLTSWGFVSRSAVLATRGFSAPEGVSRLVLAGTPDMPGLLSEWLKHSSIPLSVLIAAPGEEADAFDDFGRPLWREDDGPRDWNQRTIGWPVRGEVIVTSNPRHQATEAVRVVANASTSSSDLTLGCADEETASELVHAFGRAGWSVYDPSRIPLRPIVAWLAAWRDFVAEPGTASAIDMLAFSQTDVLVSGQRSERTRALSVTRDRFLSHGIEDLQRARSLASRPHDQQSVALASDTLERLLDHRERFLKEGFHVGLRRMLEQTDGEGIPREVEDWLVVTEPIRGKVNRPVAFWMDLLLEAWPQETGIPPDDRVIDVQGWLELLHESGSHLVICGMNEGKVPGAASSDSWLSENIRKLLGLSHSRSRSARDAYLLTAMMAARRSTGRVDFLLAKAGASGEALLPSRLLLAAGREQLPARVMKLFQTIEPAEASLPWTLDEGWQWHPRDVEWNGRINVTGFADYLTCPFRFYLKQIVGMSHPEPERVEWNPRDYGNILHLIFERWGLDEEARDFSKGEAIEQWVHACLDKVVEERFGASPPLAVRIQIESMRQRLSWFARVQAGERAKGWRITGIEEKYELSIGATTISGRVDRIERHDDGRRRILDYKTGKAGAAEAAHRSNVSASTKLPAHLENVPEILVEGSDGRMKRWKNLQLALYSAAFGEVDELGYFAVGATEGDVALSLWEGFSAADRDAALACAKWVIGCVEQGKFWPPAVKVPWDDYGILAYGRELADSVQWKGGAV